MRFPTDQGQDAVPMIKHLKYKDVFRPVMQQVSRAGWPRAAAPASSAALCPLEQQHHTLMCMLRG